MTTIHGLRQNVAALLDFIHSCVAEHGVPPTYDEMTAAQGIGRSAIAHQLAVLEARGWIKRPGQKAAATGAGISVTGKAWPPTAASTTSTVQQLTGSTRT